MSETLGLYYIWNGRYQGNCLEFWAIDAKGYTTDIDQAWVVSEEQAKNICSDPSRTDTPLSVEEVNSKATLQLHCEKWRGWE